MATDVSGTWFSLNLDTKWLGRYQRLSETRSQYARSQHAQPGQTLTTPYRGSYGSGAIASVTLTKVWKTRACFSSSQDTDDWVSDHLSRRALGTVAGALAGAKVPRAAIQYQGACTCPLLLNKRTILWTNDGFGHGTIAAAKARVIRSQWMPADGPELTPGWRLRPAATWVPLGKMRIRESPRAIHQPHNGFPWDSAGGPSWRPSTHRCPSH
jgi:hypothetical protein